MLLCILFASVRILLLGLDVARYAFGQTRSMLHDTSGQSPQSLMIKEPALCES